MATIEELTEQFDNLPDDDTAKDGGVFIRKRAGVELVKALDRFIRDNGADPFRLKASDNPDVAQARALKERVGVEVFGVLP